MKENSLWYKVFLAKYNSEVPSHASNWWKDLHHMCFGDGMDDWMNEVEFWNVNWLGSGILRDNFRRLFTLSNQQNHYIREMGNWVNGVWHWELTWRRTILNREESMVDELKHQVSNFTLTEGILDRRVWAKEEGGMFSVKFAYAILQGEVMESTETLVIKHLQMCNP